MRAATPVLGAVAAAPMRASRERVDVWQVALAAGANEAAHASLSDAERAFAARLRVGAGAWVAARAALRRVLGCYLDLDPADVLLEPGANGKPRLAPGGSTDLRFNLSHSGDVALLAVRLGHDVGVDVEQLRPGVDGAAIVRDVFSPAELAAATALTSEAPVEAFFRAWVRREALAKAAGRGIVSAPAPEVGAGHTVRDLEGIPGYTAALASEGDLWSVRRAAAR